MPNVMNRSNGKPAAAGAKATGAAKNAEPSLLNKVRQMPPRLLIGGGVALAVVLLACLWFLFGVGPEDSGKAAESASAAPSASRSASAATNTEGAAAGSQGVSAAAPGTPAASPAAAPSGSPGYANNSPASSAPAAQSGGMAAGGAASGGGTPPAEVEGLPPTVGHAGAGTTWHPNDAVGTVYKHGPASDP